MLGGSQHQSNTNYDRWARWHLGEAQDYFEAQPIYPKIGKMGDIGREIEEGEIQPLVVPDPTFVPQEPSPVKEPIKQPDKEPVPT